MDDNEIKTLAQVKEEVDPQGEKIDKEDYLGEALILEKYQTWQDGDDTKIHIVAIVQATGERVHFSGGVAMYNSVKASLGHWPVIAMLVKKASKSGNDMFLLE